MDLGLDFGLTIISKLSHFQGAACGTGVMTRNVSCVMADTDKVVPDSHCMRNLSSEQELVLALLDTRDLDRERGCYVSCHHDCTGRG